jgi:hypothetical protein
MLYTAFAASAAGLVFYVLWGSGGDHGSLGATSPATSPTIDK